MRRFYVPALLVVLVAAVPFVYPAFARQTTGSKTAHVKVYIRGGNRGADWYDWDFPATNLDDARKQFLQNYTLDGLYTFTLHQGDTDRTFLFERTEVLHVELTMNK